MSDVVSVIGPGMEIVGDVGSDGTVRVEGRVEGSIKSGKSVVVGKDGIVDGDIETQDVVVAGRVTGTITGESRVELQESCHVEGDIRSRRIKLDEGGRVDGRLHMGSDALARSSPRVADRSPTGKPDSVQPAAAMEGRPGSSQPAGAKPPSGG